MNLWQDAWSPLNPSLQHSLDKVSNNQREQQSVTATPTRGNNREKSVTCHSNEGSFSTFNNRVHI